MYYREKTGRRIFIAIILLVISLVFVFQRTRIYTAISRPQKTTDYNSILVTKAIDGDTVILADGQHVRLIGIDTPEYYESDKLFRDAEKSGLSPHVIQLMGKQAHLFTKSLCEHKRVRLEFDRQRFDRYGRLLAYLFVADGRMVNEEIIRAGYGIPYLRFHFKIEYRNRFITAEKNARRHHKGLWNGDYGIKALERVNIQ